MNCGLCGGGKNILMFYSGRHKIAKCADCGLIYTDDFKKGSVSYAGEGYFTRENQYVSRWDDFCAILEPLVDKIIRFKPGGKLLDVGAGVGVLLSIAARRGFISKGVEVSEWASAFAREKKGLDVQTGPLEAAQLPDNSFDVVVINHVLEHVERPREMLADARRILKEDGLLAIGAPNIGSFMAGLCGGKWRSLRPEQHIWHFSAETLKRLVVLSGFEVVHFEARENYPVSGWGLKALAKRLINQVSVLSGRSEAMILFARKQAGFRA